MAQYKWMKAYRWRSFVTAIIYYDNISIHTAVHHVVIWFLVVNILSFNDVVEYSCIFVAIPQLGESSSAVDAVSEVGADIEVWSSAGNHTSNRMPWMDAGRTRMEPYFALLLGRITAAWCLQYFTMLRVGKFDSN